MSASNPSRVRPLGMLILALGVGIGFSKLRSEESSGAGSCPREFAQTRMAATLLWNTPDVGYVDYGPSPVAGHHPDDLRVLVTETDAETCVRIAAVIPDSLKPLGLFAQRFAAFYELKDLYVAPVVPTVTPEEIAAEMRGERMLDEVGVTFVLDRDLRVLAAVEN